MSIKGMRTESLKRVAAAVAAAVMTASTVTGCSSSTDYSMTANGKKINAGVYINFILNEMTNQMYTMYYSGEIKEISEIFDKQVEGKDFITYIKDKALDDTKEYAAVQAKFDELGLSLSDEDVSVLENGVSNAWSTQKDFYEYEGVSRESIKMCSEVSYMKDVLFDHFYAKDGTDAVSDEDIVKYVNDNYLRYKLVTISKSDATDEETRNKENEELKALWEGYISEAGSLDFAGFDQIIDEYAAYQEQKKAEEEAAAAADDSSDELSAEELDGSEQVIDVDVPAAEAANEESSESAEVTTTAATEAPAGTAAETEAPAETTPAETSAPEETTTAAETAAPEETTSAAETTPELISPAPDAETAEEEEADPYKNEMVANFTQYTDSTSQYYTENYANLLTAMKQTGVGKVGSLETDDYYYVFMCSDIAERTDYAPDHHDTIVHEMKDTEFDGLVKGWIEAASIVVNEKAIKRYTVREVYDRQEEYASKQR